MQTQRLTAGMEEEGGGCVGVGTSDVSAGGREGAVPRMEGVLCDVRIVHVEVLRNASHGRTHWGRDSHCEWNKYQESVHKFSCKILKNYQTRKKYLTTAYIHTSRAIGSVHGDFVVR